MKKLLVLMVGIFLLMACTKIKRPGMQLKAPPFDPKVIRYAANPDSDYMQGFENLIKENPNAYINYDEDSFTYIPNSGDVVDIMQHGVWENLSHVKIQIEILQHEKLLKAFTLESGEYIYLSLMPGTYKSRLITAGALPVEKNIQINAIHNDASSKLIKEEKLKMGEKNNKDLGRTDFVFATEEKVN